MDSHLKVIFIFRNKEEISASVLTDVRLIVLPGPSESFTEIEMMCLKTFIEDGGSILVTLGEGGEKAFQTNINFLLEEFGIMINNGKQLNYDLILHLEKKIMLSDFFFCRLCSSSSLLQVFSSERVFSIKWNLKQSYF